jgi:hypothetical protein
VVPVKLALLAAWLALPLLVGVASAEHRCYGVVTGLDRCWTDDHRLATIIATPVDPPCFQELLAASQAWAKATDSVYFHAADIFIAYLEKELSREALRTELRRLVPFELRWRRAVEACGP